MLEGGPRQPNKRESNEPSPLEWKEMLRLAEENNFDGIFDLIDQNKLVLTQEQKDYLNEKQDALQRELMKKEEAMKFLRSDTMNHLFQRLEFTNENVNQVFETELVKRFNVLGCLDAFFKLENKEALEEAKSVTIIDFFNKYGYSEEDILTFLPIKFS